MHAHQRKLTVVCSPAALLQVSAHQRHVEFVIHVARIRDHAEIAIFRGQHRFGNAPHVALVLHPVADQVRDRHQLQPVLLAEFRQLRDARHRAVVVHHFADHAGRIEPGDARKIDGSFRLPGAHQHAAVARAQRVDVARDAPDPPAAFWDRSPQESWWRGRKRWCRWSCRGARRSARRTACRTPTCSVAKSAPAPAIRSAARSASGRSARGRTSP